MPARLATCVLVTWLCLLVALALPLIAGDCFDSDGTTAIECPVDINNAAITMPIGSTIAFLSGDILVFETASGGTGTITVGADFVPELCLDDGGGKGGGVAVDPLADPLLFNATADNVNNTRYREQHPDDVGEAPFTAPGLEAALADLEQELSNGDGGLQQLVNNTLLGLGDLESTPGPIGQLARDSAIASMRSLSATSTDIKPLVRSINNSIRTLSDNPQTDPASVATAVMGAITALDLLARTPASQQDAAGNRERLGALDNALTLYQNATRQQASNAEPDQAEQLNTAADRAQLARSRVQLALDNSGSAMDLITSLPESTARDQTLVQTLDTIVKIYPYLTPAQQGSIDLAGLGNQNIDALDRLRTGASDDPALFTTFSVALGEAQIQAGQFDAAAATFAEGMDAVGSDPVLGAILGGNQIAHGIFQLGEDPGSEEVRTMVLGVPPEARPGAIAVAFDHLGSDGNVDGIVTLTRNLDLVSGPDSDALQIQGMLSRIDAEFQQPGGAAQEEYIGGLIGEAIIVIGNAPGLEDDTREVLTAGLTEAQKGLQRLGDIRETVGDPDAQPVEGFVVLAQEALSMGQLDLAGDAIDRAFADLPDLGMDGAITSLEGIYGIINGVQARLDQDPTLSDDQRARGQTFIDDVQASATAVTQPFFESSASNDSFYYQSLDGLQGRFVSRHGTIRSLEEDPEANADALGNQNRRLNTTINQFRTVSQLFTRIQLVDVPADQTATITTPLLNAANGRIEMFNDELRTSFNDFGYSVTEGDTGLYFNAGLSTLNSIHAIRDGIQDVFIDTAPWTGPTDARNVRGAGPFMETDQRQLALRQNLQQLNGTAPGELFSGNPSRVAEHENREFKNSARFSFYNLSNHANYTDDPDHWLEFGLAENNYDYLQKRGAQLIFENPAYAGDLDGARNQFIAYNQDGARIVRQFGDYPTFLEDIWGAGDAEEAYASVIDQGIVDYRELTLLQDFERTRDTDPQAALGYLSQIRQNNLNKEQGIYYDLATGDPTVRGPVRATGLAWRSTEIQNRFAAVIQDHGRVDAALQIASVTPVESLRPDVRDLLTSRGYIVDGQYFVPATVNPTPVSIGSDFDYETTSVVDQHLNLANAGNLALTVVLPGKIAGTLAQGTFGQLTLRFFIRKAVADATTGQVLLGALRMGIAFGGERLVETAVFTGLTTFINLARDPSVIGNQSFDEFISGTAHQFAHDFAVISSLRILGGVSGRTQTRLAKGQPGPLNSLASHATDTLAFGAEVGVLTGVGKLGQGGLAQPSAYDNALTVLMLRMFHVFQQPAGPGRVSQIRDALVRFDAAVKAENARQRAALDSPSGGVQFQPSPALTKFLENARNPGTAASESATGESAATAPPVQITTPGSFTNKPLPSSTGGIYFAGNFKGEGMNNITYDVINSPGVGVKISKNADREAAARSAQGDAEASALLARNGNKQFGILDINTKHDPVLTFVELVPEGYKPGPDLDTLTAARRDQMAADKSFTAEHVDAQLQQSRVMVEGGIVHYDAKPDNFAYKTVEIGKEARLEGNRVVLDDGRVIEVDGQRVVIVGNEILRDGNPVQTAALIDHGQIGRFLDPRLERIQGELEFGYKFYEIYSIARSFAELGDYTFGSAAEAQAKVVESKRQLNFDLKVGEFESHRFSLDAVYESGAIDVDAYVLSGPRARPVTDAIAANLTPGEYATKAQEFRQRASDARSKSDGGLSENARKQYQAVAERHDLRADAFDKLARGETVNVEQLKTDLMGTQFLPEAGPGSLGDFSNPGFAQPAPEGGSFGGAELNPYGLDPASSRSADDIGTARLQPAGGTAGSGRIDPLTLQFGERTPTVRLGEPGAGEPGPIFFNPGGEALRGTQRMGSLTYDESAPTARFPSPAVGAGGPVFFSAGPVTRSQQARLQRMSSGFEHFDIRKAFQQSVHRQDAQASSASFDTFFDPVAPPLISEPRPNSIPR